MMTSLLAPILRQCTAVASRRPVLVLLTALLLAAASVWYASLNMGFVADRNELIDQDLEWNQRFLQWWRRFPGTYDLLVAVDVGESAAEEPRRRRRAEQYAEWIASRIEKSPEIENVDWGAPADHFSPQTVRQLPPSELEGQLRELEDAAELLEVTGVAEAIAATAGQLSARDLQEGGNSASPERLAEQIGHLALFIGALHRIVAVDAPGAAPRSAEAGAKLVEQALEGDAGGGWQYLTSPTGRLLFLRVTPRLDPTALVAHEPAIEAVRAVMDAAKQHFPEVEAGLTGVEAVESDETRIATADSTIASILAIIMISALLIFAFRSAVTPSLMVAALLIAVAWSFGYLTLAVGHLQVISVVFIVILLGLGIDFGIHLVIAYQKMRPRFPDGKEHFEAALAATFGSSAAGITCGAVTTAAAFGTTVLTDFRGVAEMGIIAAGGVLLSLVVTFTVLPALLRLMRHSHRHVRSSDESGLPIFRTRWVLPISRHPWRTLIIVIAVCLAALVPGSRIRFDYDLMALQPRNVESVRWQERIAEVDSGSIWFGVSIVDDLEEARRRYGLFLQQPTVSAVGGIGILFEGETEQKQELLQRSREALDDRVQRVLTRRSGEGAAASDVTALRNQLAVLESGARLALARPELPAPVADALRGLQEQAARLRASLNEGDVAQLDSAFAEWQRRTAARIDEVLDPAPLDPNDFPASIMRTFIDRTEPAHPRYALYVYPRLPQDGSVESPLATVFLPRFISDLQEVDPEVTGTIVQIYRSSELMKDAFRMAGGLALLAVLVIVWIDFRSLIDALCCLLPVAIAFLATFAIMTIVGLKVNPANLLVLPLLFGIGVDAGVHILHRYRLNPGQRPLGLTEGTGRAITLTGLTTVIGFASMIMARHRGIASLGLVLTLGIVMTLIVSWVVLPAVLELRQRRRERIGLETPSHSSAPDSEITRG